MKESNEAMSPLYLVPLHVHLCEADGQTIFLDLRRDKYLAIGPIERQALSGHVSGWPQSDEVSTSKTASLKSSGSVIRSMVSLGLLTNDASYGKAAAPLSSVETVNAVLVDDDFDNQPATNFNYLVAFLFACAKAKLGLHLFSLERVVYRVRKRKERHANRQKAASLQRLRELVANFERLRPFVFTARDACLFDSLALIEFLALFSCYPTWVFAVHAKPFSAHSWVQQHGFVFNGTVEFIRRYTPILAI